VTALFETKNKIPRDSRNQTPFLIEKLPLGKVSEKRLSMKFLTITYIDLYKGYYARKI
jgi:hypothetical protein